MFRLRIKDWLVVVLFVSIPCTARITHKTTNDKHERCHPTEYRETTVVEAKFLWFVLGRRHYTKTIYNDWSEECN